MVVSPLEPDSFALENIPSPKETYSLQTIDLYWLVVSNIFYFHPNLGKIPILSNIFQRG